MAACAMPRSKPSNNVHALHKSLLDMYPHRLHVSTRRLVNSEPYGFSQKQYILTLRFLRSFYLLPDLEGFSRMYDVDDCARPGSLKILEERSRMSPICVGRVNALR